jgi:hypothetical protein
MTRAAVERRLEVAEQRAARLAPPQIPPDVAEWMATLSTEQLEAVEKLLDMIMSQPK